MWWIFCWHRQCHISYFFKIIMSCTLKFTRTITFRPVFSYQYAFADCIRYLFCLYTLIEVKRWSTWQGHDWYNSSVIGSSMTSWVTYLQMYNDTLIWTCRTYHKKLIMQMTSTFEETIYFRALALKCKFTQSKLSQTDDQYTMAYTHTHSQHVSHKCKRSKRKKILSQ